MFGQVCALLEGYAVHNPHCVGIYSAVPGVSSLYHDFDAVKVLMEKSKS
jgi:hypothetical protein